MSTLASIDDLQIIERPCPRAQGVDQRRRSRSDGDVPIPVPAADGTGELRRRWLPSLDDDALRSDGREVDEGGVRGRMLLLVRRWGRERPAAAAGPAVGGGKAGACGQLLLLERR